jgi:hypothetical protein
MRQHTPAERIALDERNGGEAGHLGGKRHAPDARKKVEVS